MMIRDRKKLYWEEGGERTPRWREEKKRVDEVVKNRKKEYIATQKTHLLAEDANRNFYKHVRNFSKLEKPPQFDVRTLVPGKTDEEAAAVLAEFFNKVSREFDPLEPSDVPCPVPAGCKPLAHYQVAARLRKMRKPKSMVPGDIYPQLVTKFADFLAIPLTDIYNEILSSYVWPVRWKKEYVLSLIHI